MTGDKKNLEGMNKLWAPWRMKYIEGVDTNKAEGCIFCTKPHENDDDANYIVYRGETCFVILNIFPYNNGHVMVIPYRHTASLADLSPEERLELVDLTEITMSAIRNVMRPDGFNVGINFGRAAGAGIDEHMHVHIVPRWNGDTNFMPVIGCTKVICESPEDTLKKLKPAIENIIHGSR
jgi:ATP adenylyltransferase